MFGTNDQRSHSLEGRGGRRKLALLIAQWHRIGQPSRTVAGDGFWSDSCQHAALGKVLRQHLVLHLDGVAELCFFRESRSQLTFLGAFYGIQLCHLLRARSDDLLLLRLQSQDLGRLLLKPFLQLRLLLVKAMTRLELALDPFEASLHGRDLPSKFSFLGFCF